MAQIKGVVKHTFPESMGFIPLDALRFRGSGASYKFHCVGQTGLFGADEAAWNYDDGGRWRGPAPMRTVAHDLRINGATSERWGNDWIQRTAATDAMSLVWTVQGQDQATASSMLWEYEVWNATDNTYHSVGTHLAGTRKDFPANTFTNGKTYLAAVRLGIAEQPFRLPAGYTRNDARYKWGAASTDYWDYSRNVGKLPPPGNASYAKRNELIAANTIEDRPEDADYIVGADEVGGEWSARGFVVGVGAPSVHASFIPPCGASRYELSEVSTTTRTAKPLDWMARSGNVLRVSGLGTLLLAGQRMTPTGPVAALWESEDGTTWALLGSNINPSTGMCECALSNHGPTKIEETPDGLIYVLTKCSKHRYRAGSAMQEERLPGVPESNGGHPGGQSLTLHEGKLYHTTENFGQTSFTAPDGSVRPQFYDYLVIQDGDRIRKGPGTVFHGTNDMDRYMGRLWGVMQDKPDNVEGATQYITWFDGADWSYDTSLQYPAKTFLWQRLLGYNSGSKNLLLAWGKRAADDTRLMGVGDGRYFSAGTFGYAIRRATVSAPATVGMAAPGESVVLCPARAATAEGIGEDWHLVETKGEHETVVVSCLDELCACMCYDYEALVARGISPEDDLPAFVVWYVEQGTWRSKSEQPDDSRPWKAKDIDLEAGTVCYCGEGGPPTEDCNGLEFDLLTGEIRRVNVDAETGEIISYCDDTDAPPPMGSEVIVLHRAIPAGESRSAIQVVESGAAHLLENFRKQYACIRVRVDAFDQDPDDPETYPQVLGYSIWEPLYKEAKECIEVMYFFPGATNPLDIVPQFFVRN